MPEVTCVMPRLVEPWPPTPWCPLQRHSARGGSSQWEPVREAKGQAREARPEAGGGRASRQTMSQQE